MRVAYDVPDGSPLRQWSPFDFQLGSADYPVTSAGGALRIIGGNTFEFTPSDVVFSVGVSGFDPTRDLVVDARAQSEASE